MNDSIGILKDCNLIYEILSARGFFLELINNDAFVSDNSHKEDSFAIDNILRTYNIGYVYDNRLIIVNSDNANKLKELFSEKHQIMREECCNFYDWSYFKQREHGFKIPTMDLEPYIARYIKAISSIGLLTYSCCDGNHKTEEPRVKIGFAGEASIIWHKYLWKAYLNDLFDLNWEENYTSIVLTRKNREYVYRTINEVAAYIYNNRFWFRDLKKQSTRWINRSIVRDLSSEEIAERTILLAKEYKKYLSSQ